MPNAKPMMPNAKPMMPMPVGLSLSICPVYMCGCVGEARGTRTFGYFRIYTEFRPSDAYRIEQAHPHVFRSRHLCVHTHISLPIYTLTHIAIYIYTHASLPTYAHTNCCVDAPLYMSLPIAVGIAVYAAQRIGGIDVC